MDDSELKVTPAVRKLWCRLLNAVPNSRLLLKAKPFACQTIQQRFLASMAAEGIESWRIDLSPLAGGTGHHLSMYGMMDVALDTFPYAGTTTTCEAGLRKRKALPTSHPLHIHFTFASHPLHTHLTPTSHPLHTHFTPAHDTHDTHDTRHTRHT